jgi:DNA-binding transcriptional LysR family regulator
MSFDLRHLRAFIAVAEEQSYRRAALRLRVAQPALSRTIQQLEFDLEARLLERTTRVVEPTEAGRHLLVEGRALLAAVARTADQVRRIALGQRGELTVGFNDFTISEILPPLVSAFRRHHPEVRVTLVSAASPAMMEMVADRRLDIGFVSGVVPRAGLESAVVREERLVCVMPRRHPLAARRWLKPRDLAGQPFVLGGPGWEAFWPVVTQYCEAGGFTPNVVQTGLHTDSIINLVAAGLGVTISVERRWVRRRDDVVVRALRGPRPPYRSIAVWREGPRSASLDAMVEMVKK